MNSSSHWHILMRLLYALSMTFPLKFLASCNTYISDSQKDFHLPCDPFPIASTTTKKVFALSKLDNKVAAPLGHSQCNCELGAAAGFTLRSRFWWGVLLTTEPQCWHKSTAEFPKRRSLASSAVALLCCVSFCLSCQLSKTQNNDWFHRVYIFSCTFPDQGNTLKIS